MLDLYIFYVDKNLDINIDNQDVRNYLIESKKIDFFPSLVAYSNLIRILKDKYQIRNLSFDFSKKPKLVDNKIFFNISHTENVVVIGISNQEIGIDIENLNRITSSNFNRILSKEEYDYYVMLGRLNRFLIETYVKKEAYLKYLGVGINTKFNQIDTTKLSFFKKKFKDYLICVYPNIEKVNLYF